MQYQDNNHKQIYKVESFNESDDFGEGEAEDTQFVKSGGLSAQMKMRA